MLVENSTIWETRIQNVDALLSAQSGDRRDVYYLATVCQVGVDPPLVSIAPNPEYPVCATIQESGLFAVNFLDRDQGGMIDACTSLDRSERDKLDAGGFRVAESENGVPMLRDALQTLECRVVHVMDSGDHRTFIGEVIGQHRWRDWRHNDPHRFRGGPTPRERMIKRILCQTHAADAIARVRGILRPPLDITEGTRLYVGEPEPIEPFEPTGEDRLAALCAAKGDHASMDGATGQMTASHTGTASVGPQLAPATPGICLVGCGWWGAVHALELKKLGGNVRRYFTSRNVERAREFKARFAGEGAFAGLEEALADPRVDAVLLALPHHLHADAARQAIAAGKHVLVEKPLTLDVDEGEALVRAARDARVCLAVAEQYRLSPLVQKAHELIQQGLIGQVSLVNAGVVGTFRPKQSWKNSRETMGGGVLLDVGVHYVDIMRLWLGDVDTVWATRPRQLYAEFQGEDAAQTVLEFRGGAVGSLGISWSGFRSPRVPHIEVIGERGSLMIDFKKPYVMHAAPLPGGHWSHGLRQRLPWRIEEATRRFFPSATEKHIPVRGGDLIGSQALVHDFVRAITSGTPPAVSGAEGLEDLRVVRAAYEALETGAPVRLRAKSED